MAVEQVGDVKHVRRLPDDFKVPVRLDPQCTQVRRPASAEDLTDGLSRLVRRRLRKIRNVPGDVARAQGSQRLTAPEDVPVRGREVAQKQFEQRRLARTVGAEKHADPARGECDSHVAKHRVIPRVGKGEVVGREGHGLVAAR